MSDKTKAIEEGVGGAFYTWMCHHPITMQDTLQMAIEKAVHEWLDGHEDEILKMMAEKVK